MYSTITRLMVLSTLSLLPVQQAIAGNAIAADPVSVDERGSGRNVKRNCQMPGTPPEDGLRKCTLGTGSGNATESEAEYWRLINGGKAQSDGQDPDMGGHEGLPPNSQGSGTR
jgi:hypothetical protein